MLAPAPLCAGFFYWKKSTKKIFYKVLDIVSVQVVRYRQQRKGRHSRERKNKMKLQQLFKQIENYNMIQNVLNEAEKEILIEMDGFRLWQGKTMKGFKDYMKKEYVEEVTNAILKNENLNFDSENTRNIYSTTIRFMNRFNEPRKFEIQIWIV